MMDLVKVDSAGAVQTVPTTFDDFVAAWFASDEMFRVREQSKRSYRKSLKAFKEWTTAQGIAQATKQDVKSWCNSMDAAGYSVATKNLRLTTLRNFYKWLAAEFGIANIVDGLKGWRETREHRRGFLSCDEMRKLLSAVDTADLSGKRGKQGKETKHDTAMQELRRKRDKAILGVLLAAGLRTVEISRLRVADVKHSGGICYLGVIGKGKDEAVDVKLSRKAEQLILDWLSAREAVDVVSDNSPLFCSLAINGFGDVLSSNSVSTLCKRYLEAAGLKSKDIVAHSLRHSLATNALMKGASLMEVQQQLRHANLSTTQIYLHEAEKAANRVTDLVADEIF